MHGKQNPIVEPVLETWVQAEGGPLGLAFPKDTFQCVSCMLLGTGLTISGGQFWDKHQVFDVMLIKYVKQEKRIGIRDKLWIGLLRMFFHAPLFYSLSS